MRTSPNAVHRRTSVLGTGLSLSTHTRSHIQREPQHESPTDRPSARGTQLAHQQTVVSVTPGGGAPAAPPRINQRDHLGPALRRTYGMSLSNVDPSSPLHSECVHEAAKTPQADYSASTDAATVGIQQRRTKLRKRKQRFAICSGSGFTTQARD